MHIPEDALLHVEQMIYLPMLLIVLERDYTLFEDGAFKLKGPYLSLINEARVCIQEDLGNTKAYLKRNNIKVVKENSDELFTEYHFHYAGSIDVRRYSNIRLRNYVEYLLKRYISNIKTL